MRSPVIPTRHALLFCLAALVAASLSMLPVESSARRRPADERATARTLDPAFQAMLGSAAPPSRVEWFADNFHLPGEREQPVLAALKDTGSPGAPKYEASGVDLEVETDYGPVRVEDAHIVLSPSADGRSCRFEISAAPIVAAATLRASGTIQWGAGPGGGDKLETEFRAGALPLEALRTTFPNRFDPSLFGELELDGKAAGVVGERTTEEAPATPLRGEVEAKADWQVLGRTAPLTVQATFSIDDRMVRVNDGKMAWLSYVLPIKGWFDPDPTGDFHLRGTLSDIDTAAIAAGWNVPQPWRPASILSGTITLEGKPGKGLLRYEARADSLTLPALDGWDVRVEGPSLKGGLLEINADAAVSVRSGGLHVGGMSLGALPVGVKWWEGKLTVTSAHTSLWGGESDASGSYVPAEHPKFQFSGRLRNAVATDALAQLAPWLGLDAEGALSVAWVRGLDEAGGPVWGAHASLVNGRIGGVDLFARTLGALAAVDPALALDDPSLLPKPRNGEGTRVDRTFFELDRSGDSYEIGGLYLRGGLREAAFQLDADGRYSRTSGLSLEGTMAVPPPVADRLVAAAPWLSALRIEGASLFVPVVVRGAPSALTLELAPGFADTLASAKRGEAVEVTRAREVRHVGPEGLAVIPGDPAAADLL